MRTILRPWDEPGRLWRELCHVALGVFTGAITFTLTVALVATTTGLLIPFPLALPVAWLMFAVTHALASLERSRIADLRRAVSHLGVRPLDVHVMDLPDGGDELDQGAFDVLDVFLLLASRMEASEALDVADGWAGGSYLAYEDSEDTVCLAVRIQADSAEARDALVGGFETWAGFLPSATVTSSEAPLEVELTSCDPGDQRSSEPINAVDDAMAAPAVRLILMAEMLVGGVDGAESAWCVADGVVDELSLEQLQGEPDLEVQRLVRNVMSECSVIP